MNDSLTFSPGDRFQSIYTQGINKQFIIATYVKVQVLEITFQTSCKHQYPLANTVST